MYRGGAALVSVRQRNVPPARRLLYSQVATLVAQKRLCWTRTDRAHRSGRFVPFTYATMLSLTSLAHLEKLRMHARAQTNDKFARL